MMDWTEALEIVVGRTRHERYRVLCGDDHPDREHHRARMIELAAGRSPEYPSLPVRVANLAGAAGRVAMAAARGEPIRVSADVLETRRAICGACEFRDDARDRCTRCGCGGLKLHLLTERCPLDPPRW